MTPGLSTCIATTQRATICAYCWMRYLVQLTSGTRLFGAEPMPTAVRVALGQCTTPFFSTQRDHTTSGHPNTLRIHLNIWTRTTLHPASHLRVQTLRWIRT